MKGRVVVNTGEGKGKTTAAVGMAVRAVGRGMKVAMVQFMKGAIDTGEVEVLKRLGVEVHRMGTGFSWTKESWEEDKALARKGWEVAKGLLLGGEHQMVVLDELNYVVGYGLLEAAEVAETIQARPKGVHVVITGRGLAPEIQAVADTITEMRPIRHAFDSGIPATKGVEF